MEDNPELSDEIEAKIMEALHGGSAIPTKKKSASDDDDDQDEVVEAAGKPDIDDLFDADDDEFKIEDL